ncbi:MAG: hypothetical protein HY978_05045 [Candidatus Liptonbacteria bacterium]|nr:hypothetical protein [Candidatus Liptonbacteria bacterium]
MAFGKLSGKHEYTERELIKADLEAEGYGDPQPVVDEIHEEDYDFSYNDYDDEDPCDPNFISELEGIVLDSRTTSRFADDLVAHGDPRYLVGNFLVLKQRSGEFPRVNPALVKKRAQDMVAEEQNIFYVPQNLLNLHRATNCDLGISPNEISIIARALIEKSYPNELSENLETLKSAVGAEITIEPAIVRDRINSIISEKHPYGPVSAIRDVCGATGYVDIDQDDISRITSKLITETIPSYLKDEFESLRELAGPSRRVEIDPRLVEARAKNIAGGKTIDFVSQELQFLREATEVALNLDTTIITDIANRLVSEGSPNYLSREFQNLREATGVDPKVEPALVVTRANALAAEGYLHSLPRDLEALRLTTKVDFQINQEIIHGRLTTLIEGNNVANFFDSVEALKSIAGGKLDVENDLVARATQQILESSPISNLPRNLKALRDLAGRDLDVSWTAVVAVVNRLVVDVSPSNLKKELERLREATGISSNPDPAVVQARAQKVVAEEDISHIAPQLKSLREATSIEFVIDAATVQKRIDKIIRAESSHHVIDQLRELCKSTGTQLDLPKGTVSQIAHSIIREDVYNLAEKLRALSEITGSTIYVESSVVSAQAQKIARGDTYKLKENLKSLRAATGVDFTIDSGLIRAQISRMAADGRSSSIGSYLEAIREATGRKADIDPDVINKIAADLVKSQDNYYLGRNLKSLREATGVEFAIDPAAVRARAEKMAAEENASNACDSLKSLHESTGVNLGLSKPKTAELANRVVAESSFRYGDSQLQKALQSLREATGAELSLDRSAVEKRAAKMVAEDEIYYLGRNLKSLREATGVEFAIDPAAVRARAEKMAETSDILDLVNELESLRSAVSIPIPFDDDICSRALSHIIATSEPSYMKGHLKKLRDAFGREVDISPALVEQRAMVMVREGDISNIARNIKNLREVTGIEFAIDPGVVNERARSIVAGGKIASLGKELISLRAAVNMEYAIDSVTLDKLIVGIVSDKHSIDSAVLNIGNLTEAGLGGVLTDQNSAKIANCFVANGSIRNLPQGLEALRKACRGFVIDPAAVQERARRVASGTSIGERPTRQLSILRETTGVPLELDLQAASKLANRLLAEDEPDNLAEGLKFLRDAVGVELKLDQTVLNMRANKIVTNGRIGSLDVLTQATGMKLDLNPAGVKERAAAIITKGDIQYMAKELKTLHVISGIQFDFDPAMIEERARVLIKQDHPRQLGGDLVALREATGLDFAVDPIAVRDRAKEILNSASIFDIAQSIEDLRAAVQIDLALDADMIRSRAAKIVAEADSSMIMRDLQGLRSATGIEFDLSPESKIGIENRAAVASFLAKQKISEALKQINAIETFAGPITEEYLSSLTNETTHPKDQNELIACAQKIFELRSQLKVRSAVASFTEKLNAQPWGSALSSLLKRQHWVSRDEYNPWKSELLPLLTTLASNREFDFEKPEAARELQEFGERFGFLNLPGAYRLVRDCVRTEDPKAMLPESIANLLVLNIDVSKFSSGREILNAFSQTLVRFQESLLSDELPPGWDSPLGKEIISRLKGGTQWERGHDVVNLVQTWERTASSHPELAVPPLWQKEGKFEVRLLKRRSDEAPEEQAEAIEALWESEEMEERYYALADPLRHAFKDDNPITWWGSQRDRYAESIASDRRQMNEYMMATDAWWGRAIQDATDEEARRKLQKMRQRLANPQARAGIEQNLRQLEEDEAAIRKLDISGGDPACATAISYLSSRRGGPQLQNLIKATSAVHLAGIVPDGWRENLAELFSGNEDENLKRLEGISEFLRQYVSEHYLHSDQDPAHTDHQPLPEEVRRRLVSLWQVQPGRKQFPIEEVRDKVRRLFGIGGETGKQEPTIPVRMRPVAGMFYILSGDVGDACYTSQHGELAAGKFPNVKAWIYTSGGEKSPEILRGSLLGIRAEEKGTSVPVLVARANNPRQNFISSIDANDFVLQSLQIVIQSAREIAKNKNSGAKVVLPLDGRGASCSNRQEIADTYKRRFRSCGKITLVETSDTKFNGYQIWNKDGVNASGVVWEITPDGEEHWYGNWDQSDNYLLNS